MPNPQKYFEEFRPHLHGLKISRQPQVAGSIFHVGAYSFIDGSHYEVRNRRNT